MKQPQFAERQYEVAVHIEIARGGAAPFVPTQNAEMHLGIDAAADPVRTHAIWRILSVQVPRRVALLPSLWPALPERFHDQISGRFCSLFLQFKCPVFQDHARAKYRTALGSPYFDVSITSHQQKTLLQLEGRVSSLAVVRYASPAFWSRTDFDRYDEQRAVLANSAFISPIRVKSHRKWMYTGVNGKVVVNPDPEDTDPEPWAVIIQELQVRAVRQSLRQHVRDLAAALGAIEESLVTTDSTPWFRRLQQYSRLSRDDAGLIADLSSVAQAADRAGLAWLVLLDPDEQWKAWFREERSWWFGPWRY